MELRATVELYHGRWIARCPCCHNREQFGTCDDGSVGGLALGSFWCRPRDPDFVPPVGPFPFLAHGGCGFRGPAVWPPYKITDIEALVMCRPVVSARNWKPGEDLVDLMEGNVMHGVVPKGPLTLTSDRIMPLRIES